jgi:Flp pilus assembly pilin Flp
VSCGQDLERGASSVEYGLLIVAIAAVLALAVLALGGVTDEMFTDTCDEFDSQASVTATC